MMTILGKRFTNRGVSVIIAALLLIAISVAAAVLLYVFSIGLLGGLQGSGGQQMKDQLILEAWKWGGTTLTANFRNTGSTSIAVSSAIFYLNGTSVTGTGCATLTPTQGCTEAITTLSTFTVGQAYSFKVALVDGGVMAYAVIYGSSA